MKKIFTLVFTLTTAFSLFAQTTNYDIMPITMDNLVVTQQDGYKTLEASYPDMALSVALNLLPDGKIKDDSQVKHGNNILPIANEATITCKTDETKGDVYTGLVVVEMGDEESGIFNMGLDLTLYSAAAKAIDVTVNNATITIEKVLTSDKNDPVPTYAEFLEVSAQWDNHTLTTECSRANYEGVVEIIDTYVLNGATVQNTWIAYQGVITILDNLLTIQGQFTCSDTQSVYNVSITGTIPTTTALDNINTTAAPTKVIQNGQLYIIRNGIKYNAAGAVMQ